MSKKYKFWYDFGGRVVQGHHKRVIQVWIHCNETGQTSSLHTFVPEGTKYSAFAAIKDAEQLIVGLESGAIKLSEVKKFTQAWKEAREHPHAKAS